MYTSTRRAAFAAFIVVVLSLWSSQGLLAQSAGSSGSVAGIVTDASGAVVPGADVSIINAVSGLSRKTTTDASGRYQFSNIPFNPYHLNVSISGFAPYSQDVVVRSLVPVAANATLQIGTSSTVVNVDAGDLLEADTTMHTDIDRDLFNKLPLESASSSLSSLVTLASPGVAADSNGLFQRSWRSCVELLQHRTDKP